MARFQGKIVIVTGAARGMGAADIRRFHSEGAHVVVTDVLVEEGKALADSLGERALFIQHDVSNEASWKSLFETVEATFGGVDVLVNNAGIYRPATIAETDAELVEKLFRINQLGTFLGMKYAIEPIKRRGGGSIINMSSVVGMAGKPSTMAYASTKWAVRGMTKIAASELAEFKIRVNSVHPGYISTEMLNAHDEQTNVAGWMATPMKRPGTSEEVAGLVAFLASDDSTFVTGAEITVDGGWTL